MSLQERLTGEMKEAMKAGDKVRLGTIRLLLAALKNEQIAKMGPLVEADELDILTREAKRRRESIEAFQKGGRPDLVDRESAELAILEAYLPAPLGEDDVRALAREIIAATGAAGPKDLGKVMGPLMAKVKGRFPGQAVRPIVQDLLAGGAGSGR